ncbi:LptM family lipoprotein [Butyrivibrio sp. VCB2006]|uniref:LptM family lipoprotein n=1 Tax=Butyrivibrio sp. VCB2006 TaxID=1280679 RepID=UPI0004925C97|nr:lipoprotein [Butyrivibrio sp. VCB2006]
MYKLLNRAVCSMLAMLMLIFMVTGCGQKGSQELEDYKTGMTEFYDKLSQLDDSMNNIDTSSDTAKLELLGYLDEMNEAYKVMAATAIPEEFSGIADIAAEAADYMQMANESYHEAYDGEFNEESEMLASQYYERANSRVNVMLQVLHGEIPEGDGVIVTTQEAGQFSTIGATSE